MNVQRSNGHAEAVLWQQLTARLRANPFGSLGQLRKPENKTEYEGFWRLHTLKKEQSTG
jgi:hypothetical protein